MPIYLVAAYAVFWALTFALVFSIWARQRKLEREIGALLARLAEKKEGKESEGNERNRLDDQRES